MHQESNIVPSNLSISSKYPQHGTLTSISRLFSLSVSCENIFPKTSCKLQSELVLAAASPAELQHLSFVEFLFYRLK